MLTNIDTYEKFSSHIFVSRETYEKLFLFHKTLIKWQKSINLISKNTIKNTWERHFLDSAQLYKFVRDIEGNIIDFGSGIGTLSYILKTKTNLSPICIEIDCQNKKVLSDRGFKYFNKI